jgi:hypothetical protein
LSRILEFLSRPGCHLCDEVRPAVHRVASRRRLVVVEIDIDQHDHLVTEFGLRIPVVRRNGEVVAEGAFDYRRLLARVR